jgi:hypothetical protein
MRLAEERGALPRRRPRTAPPESARPGGDAPSASLKSEGLNEDRNVLACLTVTPGGPTTDTWLGYNPAEARTSSA